MITREHKTSYYTGEPYVIVTNTETGESWVEFSAEQRARQAKALEQFKATAERAYAAAGVPLR